MTPELLPAIEISRCVVPRTSVIWLHGLGADGHDFEPIVGELALPSELDVRFVFPHAPERPVTINGGLVMRAWYDIVSADFRHRVDEAGIRASRQEVTRLIQREQANGIPASRILLAGFSQGGVIALETGVRYAELLGGVIALSAYLPEPERFPAARAPLPIFMGHGTADPIVPYAVAQHSGQELQRKGYPVEWHSYAMPHSVCGEEIAHLRAWIIGVLGADGPG